jgi:hypothetical protein
MFPYINKVKKCVFLQFNERKKGGGKLVLPPSTFQSGKGDCPQLLCPWSGISEVQLQTHGVSEFTSVRSFSGVFVAQSSVFSVFVIFCQPLNICLLFCYTCIFISYIVNEVIYWPLLITNNSSQSVV